MVALAGLASGAAPLRELLPREKEANARQKIIEALALLGSADEVKLLTERYAAEERDCQWATFKAMSYIGGDAAMSFVKAEGLKSDNDVVKHIAQDLLAP